MGKRRRVIRLTTRIAILVTLFLFVFGTGENVFGVTLPFVLTQTQANLCFCVMGIALIVSAGVRRRRKALRVLVGIAAILTGLMLM